MFSMKLVVPHMDHLPSYKAALEKRWSPDNTRPKACDDELAAISADPKKFVDSMTDREAKGEPITLQDGSKVARLPSIRLWMWDGEFCGSIGFRWQNGTEALPPYCLGHIGYSVVPWKRQLGYATEALKQVLPEARALGLRHVDITTDPDNVASQKVVMANGGVLVETFIKPAAYGHKTGLLFRIAL